MSQRPSDHNRVGVLAVCVLGASLATASVRADDPSASMPAVASPGTMVVALGS